MYTYAYLVVLGVVILVGVLVVGGLVGGQEGGLVEGLGGGQVEVQEAEDEASGPSCLQVYQEASRTEEHLKIISRKCCAVYVWTVSTTSTSFKTFF